MSDSYEQIKKKLAEIEAFSDEIHKSNFCHCGKRLVNPYLTPCGHVLCIECINKLFGKNVAGRCVNAVCPICHFGEKDNEILRKNLCSKLTYGEQNDIDASLASLKEAIDTLKRTLDELKVDSAKNEEEKGAVLKERDALEKEAVAMNQKLEEVMKELEIVQKEREEVERECALREEEAKKRKEELEKLVAEAQEEDKSFVEANAAGDTEEDLSLLCVSSVPRSFPSPIEEKLCTATDKLGEFLHYDLEWVKTTLGLVEKARSWNAYTLMERLSNEKNESDSLVVRAKKKRNDLLFVLKLKACSSWNKNTPIPIPTLISSMEAFVLAHLDHNNIVTLTGTTQISGVRRVDADKHPPSAADIANTAAVANGLSLYALELPYIGPTLEYGIVSGMIGPEHAYDIARQLVSALMYLYHMRVVHCNICPENIFLASLPPYTPRVVLGGFGHAFFANTDHNLRPSSPSPSPYRPEVHEKNWSKIDVFSLGMVISRILDPPSDDDTDSIRRLHALVAGMTCAEPKARKTILEVASELSLNDPHASRPPKCVLPNEYDKQVEVLSSFVTKHLFFLMK